MTQAERQAAQEYVSILRQTIDETSKRDPNDPSLSQLKDSLQMVENSLKAGPYIAFIIGGVALLALILFSRRTA